MGYTDGTKMRGYAVEVYKRMVRDSKVEPGTKITDPDLVIWQGSVSSVFRDLGIAGGYHSILMRLLEQMGCLTQLRRGSRAVESRYLLQRDPTSIPSDDWPSINSIVKSPRERLTGQAGGYKLLEQRMNTLEERLPTINIARALAELSQLIASLDTRITAIEQRFNDNAKNET